jgi:hypothetical protein
MSTTTQVPTRVTPIASASGVERQPVWKRGVAAAVVASVATTVLAALASAAGVSFADSTGASIPIAGFAQLTMVFSLVGVGIAAVARTVPLPFAGPTSSVPPRSPPLRLRW